MSDSEINKAIHEKIIGGCWYEFGRTQQRDRFGVYYDICKNCNRVSHSNPDYCNSISDAFRVVEKLIAKSFTFHLNGGYYPIGEGRQLPFNASFGRKARWAEDLNPAKAICLAAIKTIEK